MQKGSRGDLGKSPLAPLWQRGETQTGRWGGAEWNLITRTIIPSSTQNRPSRAPTTRVGWATSLQPFVSYSTKTHTTFGLNTESAYDWEHSHWTVPINVTVSQLLKIGGPDWGLRFTVTFLFPK